MNCFNANLISILSKFCYFSVFVHFFDKKLHINRNCDFFIYFFVRRGNGDIFDRFHERLVPVLSRENYD